jgi:hypothetical protein
MASDNHVHRHRLPRHCYLQYRDIDPQQEARLRDEDRTSSISLLRGIFAPVPSQCTQQKHNQTRKPNRAKTEFPTSEIKRNFHSQKWRFRCLVNDKKLQITKWKRCAKPKWRVHNSSQRAWLRDRVKRSLPEWRFRLCTKRRRGCSDGVFHNSSTNYNTKEG